MNEFSDRFAALRKASGAKQTDFEEQFGLSERTVRNYETGKQFPRLDIAAALADHFNVSLDYLVGRSDDPHGGYSPKDGAP